MMIRYIYDTVTGAIRRQTATYNPAITITTGAGGLPVATPNPRYIVCREVVEERPLYDAATEHLQSTTRVDAEAALVIRGWEVQPKPPAPPEPNWQGFHRAVQNDPGVAAVIDGAPRRLALGLAVGLGQAAQGDPRTFAEAWGMAREAGAVPPELAQQVEVIAGAYNLPGEFMALLSA